jgi:hypothetical protein
MNRSRSLLVWPVLTRSRMAAFEVITEALIYWQFRCVALASSSNVVSSAPYDRSQPFEP